MSDHSTSDPAEQGDDAPGPGSPTWANRLEQLATEAPTGRRNESRRVADAMRRVIHGLVVADADEDTLASAADRLEEIATAFDATVKRSMYEGFAESANSGDPHGFFDHSPMLGRANPLAPPLVLRVVDDHTMEGTGVFGPAYEGPPGCVHGGYIAAAFDEVLGSAQSMSGQPGMTGRLEISYRSPTPLHEALRFVGSFDRIEGRKIFTSGTLHAGERLCAEATGLFISIDFSRFAELKAEREARRSDGTGPDRSGEETAGR